MFRAGNEGTRGNAEREVFLEALHSWVRVYNARQMGGAVRSPITGLQAAGTLTLAESKPALERALGASAFTPPPGSR